MKHIKFSYKLLILFVIAFYFTCESTQVKVNSGDNKARGYVTNAKGTLYIEGAVIESGGQKIITQEDGFFEFSGLENERAVFQLSKTGYRDAVKVVTLNAKSENIILKMERVLGTQNIESSKSFQVSSKNADVVIPKDTFVNSKGESVETYNLDIEVIAANPDDMEKMPGEMRGNATDGETVALESFGAIYLKAHSKGEELTIKDGKAASITFILDEDIPYETIPMWSMDEKTGIWKEEGVGTVQKIKANGKIQSQITFEAPHLSYWNADVPITNTAILIKEIKISNEMINLNDGYLILEAKGMTYNGLSYAQEITMNAQNVYCLDVKVGEKINIMARLLTRNKDYFITYNNSLALNSSKRSSTCRGIRSGKDQPGIVIESITLNEQKKVKSRKKLSTKQELDLLRIKYGQLTKVITKDGQFYIGAFRQKSGHMIITVAGDEEIVIPSSSVAKVEPY
ncbi:MAG: hypothetical protein ABUK01_14985 [Leptospirales bacterium]